MCMSIISYGLPKRLRPVRLPKSYGPGPLIGITRCCGHMYTAVLRVICVFFGHGLPTGHRHPNPHGHAASCDRGICVISYGVPRYLICTFLTGSVSFTCGHPMGPCGFHTGIRTSVSSVSCKPYGPVRMPCGLGNTRMISGAGPFTGSGEVLECTLALYLPSQTRLCEV